jgi:hypothetical protein
MVNDSFLYSTVRFITYLLDHVHKFSLGRVLSKGSHDGAKLLGCDGACKEYTKRVWGEYGSEDISKKIRHPE